jgi:hypothetical protein
MENIGDLIIKMTAQNVVNLTDKNSLEVDLKKCQEYMVKHIRTKVQQIVAKVIEDGNKADLFNQIEGGKVGALSMEVAKVTLAHECLLFAQEIIAHVRRIDH